MTLFSRFMVLSLLAVSLHPLCSHAQPESSNASSPSPEPADRTVVKQPAAVPERQMQPPQLILSMKAAIGMAVTRNIDLLIESQNSKLASVEALKSYGIYNPVLNVSGTGGVSAVPGEAFFSTKNMTATVGLTQYIPTGGTLTATTQTGYFKFEPTTTPSREWQSTASIGFTQPLLKNAGKETFELNITLAATTHQDSLERFRGAANETVSNVITAYNRLYVLRQIRETREAALISAQTLLDGVRKSEAGAAQQLEIANAEFAIAQRRKDFIEASRNVTDQETNLRYQIGLDTPLHIVPSDPPSKVEPLETDEQAVNAALASRSDLKQLKVSLQTAQLQERVARHQSLPDLSINASGGLTGTGYNFGESYRQLGNHPGTFWTAGMLFSVPLGNTTAHNEYIKSRIRSEQARDQIKALSWRIRNDVEYDMRALISARLQMQLNDKSTQSAEQRLEQYRKSNLLKTATIQDVINAENDLNVARNSQLEAIETFSNAVTKLWKDTGLLLERSGIHIDKATPMLDLATVTGETASAPPELDQTAKSSTPSLPSTPEAVPAGAEKAVTTSNVVPVLTGKPAASKTYTLIIGEFSSKAMMADAISKIKSVGLIPQIKDGPQKTEQVVRLYQGKYRNNSSAQKFLKMLQLNKANGFIHMDENKRYVVYAGSFIDQNSAIKEQERLARVGIKVRPEKSSVSIATFLLSTGNFLEREAALKYALKLEQIGLNSNVTENP